MNSLHQMDLFSEKANLKILKIGYDDVKDKTDNFFMFKNVVSKHENMYPSIDRWFKNKVEPGILNKKRVAYLGVKDSDPVVSAIVKKGNVSKFCHLHIADKYRDNHIGDLFFSMMAIDVRHVAHSVYFTLPESLWQQKYKFFNSFGFNTISKSDTQYRNHEEELRSSTKYKTLWNNVLQKLPKIINSLTPSNESIFNGILLSIKPKFIEKMKAGKKIVEIRKSFNHKWSGCRVTLYSTKPDQGIHGYATIDKIVKGNPESIWEKNESNLGCSKEEFDSYVGSSKTIYAITLRDFTSYLNTISMNQLSWILNRDLNPPQSYLKLETNKAWTQAISVAEIMHGRFQIYSSIY